MKGVTDQFSTVQKSLNRFVRLHNGAKSDEKIQKLKSNNYNIINQRSGSAATFHQFDVIKNELGGFFPSRAKPSSVMRIHLPAHPRDMKRRPRKCLLSKDRCPPQQLEQGAELTFK